MDKKLDARKSAVALVAAMALIAISNVAQADSAYEWGYWDASPSAGANSVPAVSYTEQVASSIETVQPYNGANNLATDQNIIGVNREEFVTTSENTDASWEGYVPFTSTKIPNDKTQYVAKLGITPGKDSGKLEITSDVPEFNTDFDVKDNNPDIPRNLVYGTEEGDFTATYHKLGDPDFYRNASTTPLVLNNEKSGQYLALMKFNRFSGTSPLDTFTVNGSGYIGKKMPLADIAYQTQLGKSYTFKGDSLDGSKVIIIADFGRTTWSGSWSDAKSYDAFNAGGKITGRTLTSSSVIGTSDITSKTYVQGGDVTGTLIGVMNAGANSNAGIIGKTELNVGAVGTTAVKVSDGFVARIVPDPIQVNVNK